MTGGIDKSEERPPTPRVGGDMIVDVRIDIKKPGGLPETGPFGLVGSMEIPCHYNESLASIEKRVSESMKNAFTNSVQFLILGIRRKRE